MSTERVFRIEAKDRRSFSNELDFAITVSGARIAAGTYEVSIRRLSKKEVERIAREEAEEKRLSERREASRQRVEDDVRDAIGDRTYFNDGGPPLGP